MCPLIHNYKIEYTIHFLKCFEVNEYTHYFERNVKNFFNHFFFLILIIHTAKQYLCRDLRTIIMSHQEITDEQSAEFKRVFKRDYNFILTLPLTTLNPFSIYSFSSFVIKRCSPGELAEKKIQTAATTNNMPATT